LLDDVANRGPVVEGGEVEAEVEFLHAETRAKIFNM